MQAVRAEIKHWEKSFRAAHRRDPTVDDIRARPDIASKYRLYKRLSREAAVAPAPSTPPKKAALLPSVPRVAETTASLAAFNPFSPVKNKGKNKADSSLAARNLFATPTKSAANRALLDSPSESSESKPLSPTLPTSAVSRARKRLRGEPVSPSPNKEKKQRVDSYPKLPMPSLHLSNLDDDPVHPSMDRSGSTVIGESPIKQPAGNKPFTILFEESLPPLVLEPKKDNDTALRSRSLMPPGSSLIERPADALPSFDEDLGWLKNNHVLQGKTKRHTRAHNTTRNEASTSTTVESGHGLSKPIKRSLSEMESDTSDTLASDFRQSTFIPPSPPPETDSSFPRASKTQARFKSAIASRKKTKISDSNAASGDDSSEADDDLKPIIKVINATTARPRHGGRGNDDRDENIEPDPDPILTYTFRPAAPGTPRGNHSPRGGPPAFFHSTEPSSSVDLDLPEKLRDVLALDIMDMKARDKHAERMVERLLYNRRTIHYDPDKGGEIWDVGEGAKPTIIGWGGEVLHDTEGEDDWEGEPIPWEVAEL
ncbi:hypothetical protein AX15_001621 [Amanita polypyramis BW_CC]|nr:hypothetical protein AX15_001621 [Amanita polypyramis BW_CC]